MKVYPILLQAALSFIIASTLGAVEQIPHIGVIPLVNATGQDYFDEAARITTENIDLVLRLTGKYKVTRHEVLTNPYTDFRLIEKQAESLGFDYVIFGRIVSSKEESNPWAMELALWDKKENQIVEKARKGIPKILEIFNISDSLTQTILGNFSGMNIAFGRLIFERRGEKEAPHNIFIDGAWVGSGINDIQVLYGKRKVTVLQNIGGRERTVFSRTYDVAEGTTVKVSYSLREASLSDGVFDYPGEVPSRQDAFVSEFSLK